MANRAPLVLSVVLLLPTLGRAQQATPSFCQQDALRQGATVPERYAVRGDYCDGVVYKLHASTATLPVVGIVANRVTGSPAQSPLAIRAWSSAAVEWPLRVQAVALDPQRNYRLDAALRSSDTQLRLSRESGLAALGMDAGSVAWLAWMESATLGRVYIPLLPVNAAVDEVRITVRPANATAYVLYSVWKDDSNVLIPQATVEQGAVEGAKVVSFTIPAGEPRLVRVQVVAKAKTGPRETNAFWVLRPGPPVK